MLMPPETSQGMAPSYRRNTSEDMSWPKPQNENLVNDQIMQRADDQNSKERDVRAQDPQAAAAPSDDAPLQRFQQGDKVMYWSDTYLQWMHAVVLTAHEGGLVYDLDVKRGANALKMKFDTTGAGVANVAVQQVVETHVAAVQPQAPPPSTSNDAELPLFQKGDKVMYWSDTYNQWMHAFVIQAHDGGQAYDLDVKRGANARKIKMADPAAPQLVAPAQQVSVSTTAGGPASTPAPAASLQEPRGPSPLSVRARPTTVPATVPGGLNNMPLPPEASAQATDQSDVDDPLRPTVAVPATVLTRRSSQGQIPGGLTSNGLASNIASTSTSAGQRKPSSSQLSGVPTTLTGGATTLNGGASTPKVSLPLPARSDQPSAVETPTRSAVPSVSPSASPTAAQPSISPSVSSVLMSGASPGGYASATSGSVVVGFTLPSSASNAVSGQVVTGSPTAASSTPTSAGHAKFSVSAIQSASPQAKAGMPRPTLFMGTGTESRRAQGGATPTSVQPGNVRTTSATSAAALRLSMTPSASRAGVAPGIRWQGLEQGDLQMGSDTFNPLEASLRQQLLSQLGLSAATTVEEMQGFRGGLNEGVWYMSEPNQGAGVPREELVLKLVRCHRIASNILTEAENFIKLFHDYPNALNDKFIAFPVKLFSCKGTNGVKRHDLIVMRKVRGERLAELIAKKVYSNQTPSLLQILEKLGVCLAEFHNRYGGSNHGDFQPSNIFYDEETEETTFIDIGGMGVPTMESDVEHFNKSMNLLSEAYGTHSPGIAVNGIRQFERGYNKAIEKR